MNKIELGWRARDSITGFEGIVVARTEWLNYCVRITLQPEALHDTKPVETQVFDEAQLVVVARATPFTVTHNEPKRSIGGPRNDPGRPNDPR